MSKKKLQNPYGTKPCVIKDMPIDTYHAITDIYSKSMLDLYASRPSKFKAKLDGKTFKESSAMRLGSLAHTALLEPSTLDARYFIHTEGLSKNSNKYKELVASAAELGKVVVDQDDYDAALAMAKSVVDKFDRIAFQTGGLNPFKGSDGIAESSLFWTDKDTGLRCRCRPDWMCFDKKTKSGFIIDLKSTSDAGNGFAKSTENFRYDVSAAFYSAGYTAVYGVMPIAYLLVCVESDDPYDVCVRYATNEILDRGTKAYKKDLQGIKDSLNSNTWASFPDDFIPMELPSWAKPNR